VEIVILTDHAVGYDGEKKIKGRRRYLLVLRVTWGFLKSVSGALVDTLGLVMMVVATAANVSDQQGARLIFERIRAILERLRRLTLILVDGT
jgi:hypothetical protein